MQKRLPPQHRAELRMCPDEELLYAGVVGYERGGAVRARGRDLAEREGVGVGEPVAEVRRVLGPDREHRFFDVPQGEVRPAVVGG